MAYGFGGSFHGTTGLVILCIAALGHAEASDTIVRREAESHVAAEISPHGHLSSGDDSLALDASPLIEDLFASQNISTTATTTFGGVVDPSTVNGFRFHLRSCETNLCMYVTGEDAFGFGDCEARNPREMYVAEGVSHIDQIGYQGSSAIILPTGKRLCALADSLLMQAGEDDCEFPNVTLESVLTAKYNISGIEQTPTEFLFQLRWKWPSQNPNTLNNVTSLPRDKDICLLPPETQSGEQRLKMTQDCFLDPVVLWTNVTNYGNDKEKDPCRHAINDPAIDNAATSSGDH